MRNKIVYDGRVFTTKEIKSGSVKIHMATSLLSNSLEANTFTADVKCSDPSITNFVRNTPMIYYHRDMQRFIVHIQSVSRVGAKRYRLYGTSAIGLLMDRMHAGGIYNGETVEQVVAEICGPVPFIVKDNLKDIALYGWLPYVKPPKLSARDNLRQVLFAIGATVKTDLDGIVRIEPLWDMVSGSVERNRTYRGASVKYGSAVSGVVVTEHQYIAGTENKDLFEGTAQSGDVITFSEPMHSLSATGFTILESGANYAVLSAGTGTLSGKRYIHNTRQIARSVSAAQSGGSENVKSVTDATLVSLVNSAAVAERLANYYGCLETISGDIVLNRQTAGDVVNVYHPYQKETVQTCIESLDITASSILRAKATQLVGFKPIQVSDTEYYDYREVITADGVWTVPDGVTNLTGVLISGGRGGYSGCRGEEVEYPSEYNSTEEGYRGYDAGPGAEGGQGGDVGEGGKILQFTAQVTPGQTFQVHIGVGGTGGVHSNTGSVQGSAGGATTFGAYTSDSGASSPSGYTDILTGETYATPGDRAGIAGGKGSGYLGEGQYSKGPNVIDYDGTVWEAGPITSPQENLQEDYGPFHAESGKGCGGGAAVGANGSAGGFGKIETQMDGWDYEIYPYTGPTGHGGDAVKPAKQTRRGGGGNGGHGGGGEGGMGLALYSTTSQTTRWARISDERGYPGNGSDGGDGGDGVIILYYRQPVTVPSGAVMGAEGRIRFDRYGRLMVG